jgi:hypothetical protein
MTGVTNLDDDKQATLAKVLGALSSSRYRERAAEAADKFVREKLGLSWDDVAAAISMAATSRDEEAAPREDVDWYEIRDSKGQTGYGRWMCGRSLTVRRRKGPRGRQMWYTAVDGRPLRTSTGVQLFELLSEAMDVAEEAGCGA